MRRTTLAPAVLLLLSVPALAQPVQSLARVKVGSANLYSGPGEQMPKCGTVDQGYVVVVDHPEGNDWLAVQAPNASLSWINHLHVELQNRPTADQASVTSVVNAVVRNEDGAKLAAGQMGSGKPLNVQRTKVPFGTIVKVIGPKVRATADGDASESSWYPIIPPRDDFRYVRRADVELIGGSEKPGFVVKAVARPSDLSGDRTGDLPVAVIPGDVPPTGGGSSGDAPNHPLWRNAEKARLDGNFPLAERLFKQLAEEATTAGETTLANLCFSRIHSIRELQRQKDRGEPAARPLPLDPGGPAGGTAKKPASATVGGTGQVRVVNFMFEGRQVYALTDRRGVSLYLVSDDLDLSRYVGRWVELSGAVAYPKEFGGTGLMTATAVEKVEGK